MLVSSFNLSQSFNCTPYLFYKKLFKSEINSFCIWTQRKVASTKNVPYGCVRHMLPTPLPIPPG